MKYTPTEIKEKILTRVKVQLEDKVSVSVLESIDLDVYIDAISQSLSIRLSAFILEKADVENF